MCVFSTLVIITQVFYLFSSIHFPPPCRSTVGTVLNLNLHVDQMLILGFIWSELILSDLDLRFDHNIFCDNKNDDKLFIGCFLFNLMTVKTVIICSSTNTNIVLEKQKLVFSGCSLHKCVIYITKLYAVTAFNHLKLIKLLLIEIYEVINQNSYHSNTFFTIKTINAEYKSEQIQRL